MSSVMSKSFKQTNGYFVAVSTVTLAQQFKVSTPPSGSGGSVSPPVMAVYATGDTGTPAVIPANTLLKDMGKVLVSSSHVYRKVQAVVTGGPSIVATTPVTGVPFYIELVTGQSAQAGAAPVAYLPGLF
jgi:hypothetical protein